MMIKDKLWQKFCNRHHNGKTVHSYVQIGLAPPKITTLLFFYVTKPVAEVSGYAEFIERKVGKTEELWKEYRDESVLDSAEKYSEFVKDTKLVSFVRFKNLKEATNPIPLNNFLLFLGVNRLARRGFYINRETAEKLVAIMSS